MSIKSTNISADTSTNNMDTFPHQSEYVLLREFLKNMNIPVSIIDASALDKFKPEIASVFGYYYTQESIERYISHVIASYDRHTLYKLSSDLLCQCYLFFLPEEKVRFAFVGPFCETRPTEAAIRCTMAAHRVSEPRYSDLANYYSTLRQLSDPSILHTLLTTFCASLWGGMDRFHFAEVTAVPPAHIQQDAAVVLPSDEETSAADNLRSMDILAERYALENSLIHAVSNGELHSAEMYLAKMTALHVEERRAATPVRNSQNYSIILNTLLRKAAEKGKVHPLYIDRLSSSLAHRIEACRTLQEISQLQSDIVRKYCLLVQNHSIQKYSRLIQQALTLIHSDLTAELTLSALASNLNVNASYLSTKFKQELGETLTDYIARKRVEQAILLLNSTDLSIAEIAAACGVPDVQYFSKIFKKQIGHTPSGYRKIIRPAGIDEAR